MMMMMMMMTQIASLLMTILEAGGDAMMWYMLMNAVTSSASDVTMTSRGHMIFVHVGQSVTLDCQFHAVQFSLFDNPVVWKKTQRDEETEVNIMSNIVEPFLNTNRLAVSFAMDSPAYRMSLRIRGTVDQVVVHIIIIIILSSS